MKQNTIQKGTIQRGTDEAVLNAIANIDGGKSNAFRYCFDNTILPEAKPNYEETIKELAGQDAQVNFFETHFKDRELCAYNIPNTLPLDLQVMDNPAHLQRAVFENTEITFGDRTLHVKLSPRIMKNLEAIKAIAEYHAYDLHRELDNTYLESAAKTLGVEPEELRIDLANNEEATLDVLEKILSI